MCRACPYCRLAYNTCFCFQLKDSEIVKQGDATTKGRSEFVEEILFEKLTPGSVITFR